MVQAQGGWLCNRVRYHVRAEPIRVTICHCCFCQRATGSAYMTEPIFNDADFAITTGSPRTYEHVSAGSGKIVYVHFCQHCGTKLYLSFERFGGVVGVYAGTFDDPNWFDISPENSKHIFLSVAQRGAIIPPGINTFQEHATTNDGVQLEPTVHKEPFFVDRRSSSR